MEHALSDHTRLVVHVEALRTLPRDEDVAYVMKEYDERVAKLGA